MIKLKNLTEPLNLVLVALCLLVLAGCAALTWLRLQDSSYTSLVQQELQTKEAAIAASASQDVVPALKLNQKNVQQGPEVTINPQNLGKPDPFTP